MKNKNDNNSTLLYSLTHKIKTVDVYEDFSKDKEMFDFSNYSTRSKYYDDSNKLVFSKIKGEQLVLQLNNLLY